jgi:hypothetical protein
MDDLLLAILLASSPHMTLVVVLYPHAELRRGCRHTFASLSMMNLDTFLYVGAAPSRFGAGTKARVGRSRFPEGLRFCLLLLVSSWQRVPVFTGARLRTISQAHVERVPSIVKQCPAIRATL